MSAPFVTQLRAHGSTLELSAGEAGSISVRVEMPEVWDTVKAVVSPDASVMSLKSAALEALFPGHENASEFVLKLRGLEVLDESASLTGAGAKDGSIFLLTHRRRRAVR